MTLHDNNNNVCDTHDIEGVLLHMGFQDYAAQHNIELSVLEARKFRVISKPQENLAFFRLGSRLFQSSSLALAWSGVSCVLITLLRAEHLASS